MVAHFVAIDVGPPYLELAPFYWTTCRSINTQPGFPPVGVGEQVERGWPSLARPACRSRCQRCDLCCRSA